MFLSDTTGHESLRTCSSVSYVTRVLQMLEALLNASRVPDIIEYAIFAQASGIV
jgi:hypothetical protein